MIQHKKPWYYKYHGGYANLTQCEECKMTGLREDLHPVDPCYYCGGKVKEIGAGIWIEPVEKWSWKNLEIIEIVPGYWKLKNDI